MVIYLYQKRLFLIILNLNNRHAYKLYIRDRLGNYYPLDFYARKRPIWEEIEIKQLSMLDVQLTTKEANGETKTTNLYPLTEDDRLTFNLVYMEHSIRNILHSTRYINPPHP